MTTDRESLVYDVEDCHADCGMYDYATNKYYSLPKPDHTNQKCVKIPDTPNQRDCPTGTYDCNNMQSFSPEGNQPMCVVDCESCYKESIGVGMEMTTWVHLNVKKNGECKSEQDEIKTCLGQNHFWCKPTKTCAADCALCKEEHAKETHEYDSGFEMYNMEEDERWYNIQNYDTMMCENTCGHETKTVQGAYEDWDGSIIEYSWDWSEQKTYCPIKKSCMKNNFWPFNDPANPVTESYDHYNQLSNGPPNPCSDCGAYSLPAWTHTGRECIKPSKQACKDNWMRYCPSTKQCVHTGPEGCANECPKFGFEPPHYPNYDNVDSVSCVESAAVAANMCTDGDKYCSTDGWSHCTQNCDWCNKWTQGKNDDGTINMYDWVETKSFPDGNRCSFHGAYEPFHVETHPVIPAKDATEVNVCMANCTKADGTANEKEFQTTTISYEEVDYNENKNNDTMGMGTEKYNTTVSEWVHSYYCENHPDEYVDNCSYCEEWMDGNGMIHYSNMIPDENYMCVHPAKFGCTDKTAYNYDPEATSLEDGEVCPAANSSTAYCWSCEYVSYNNTAGMNKSVLLDTSSYENSRPFKDDDGMYMNLTGLMPSSSVMNGTW